MTNLRGELNLELNYKVKTVEQLIIDRDNIDRLILEHKARDKLKRKVIKEVIKEVPKKIIKEAKKKVKKEVPIKVIKENQKR